LSTPQKVLKPYTGPLSIVGFAIHYVGPSDRFPRDYVRALLDMNSSGASTEGDEAAVRAADPRGVMKRYARDCLVFPTGVLGSA